MQAPILIIGMHRSGTSMLARLLEEMGLFLGWRKQADHEAVFFLGLNQWLLRQCGGSWDHPTPIRYLLENREVRGLALDYLRLSVEGPRVASYLGPLHYLRHRSPSNLPGMWGWKDPRTTFTLPLWQEVFPGVRVVHVTRNGVDVSASLRERQLQILEHRRRRYDWTRAIYRLKSKRVGFTLGLRCTSLAGGFTLWEEYMEQAGRVLSELGSSGLDVRYEEFLRRPSQEVERVADFVGLPLSGDRRERLLGQLRVDRVEAHRGSSELRSFAAENAARLTRFGY
jgi:hypothetical protein